MPRGQVIICHQAATVHMEVFVVVQTRAGTKQIWNLLLLPCKLIFSLKNTCKKIYMPHLGAFLLENAKIVV